MPMMMIYYNNHIADINQMAKKNETHIKSNQNKTENVWKLREKEKEK